MRKNILKNAFGFGLVEVLMAAGIAGGIALTIAKLSQDANKVTKTTEANNEINMMMNDVAYILSDKANCLATIPPGTNAAGASISSINRLVSGSQRAVYQTGVKYGNGSFSISSIVTEQIGPNDVNLILSINRENKVTTGAKAITKRIPLKVVTTGASINSCFSDTESIITSAAERACRGTSAYWNAADGTCLHNITPVNCPSGEAVKAVTTNTGVTTYSCAPVIAAVTCDPGEYVKSINANGSPQCAPLAASANCTAGQYAVSLANGQMGCANIPQCGQQAILRTNASGVFYCENIPCNSTNQYFAGFNSGGSPVCKNFPNSSCGQGQYIKEVRPNGSIVCDTVATGTSLATIPYSFVDGYDVSTDTWSRKDINSTAAQICAKFAGYSWTGTQCSPVGAASNRWTHNTNNSVLDVNGAKLIFTDQGMLTLAPSGSTPRVAIKTQNAWWDNQGGVMNLSKAGTDASADSGDFSRFGYTGVRVFTSTLGDSTIRGKIEVGTEHGIIFDPSITSTNFVEIANNSSCSQSTEGGRLRIARIPSTMSWRLFLCTTDNNSIWRWRQISVQ